MSLRVRAVQSGRQIQALDIRSLRTGSGHTAQVSEGWGGGPLK
jgi:hypothetical protein